MPFSQMPWFSESCGAWDTALVSGGSVGVWPDNDVAFRAMRARDKRKDAKGRKARRKAEIRRVGKCANSKRDREIREIREKNPLRSRRRTKDEDESSKPVLRPSYLRPSVLIGGFLGQRLAVSSRVGHRGFWSERRVECQRVLSLVLVQCPLSLPTRSHSGRGAG